MILTKLADAHYGIMSSILIIIVLSLNVFVLNLVYLILLSIFVLLTLWYCNSLSFQPQTIFSCISSLHIDYPYNCNIRPGSHYCSFTYYKLQEDFVVIIALTTTKKVHHALQITYLSNSLCCGIRMCIRMNTGYHRSSN